MSAATEARERADALQLPRVTELDHEAFIDSGGSVPRQIADTQEAILEALEWVRAGYDVDLVYALRSAWRDLDLALAVMAAHR